MNLHERIEPKLDQLLEHEARRPDTTKRVLIGVGIIVLAVNIGWDVLKAWLF